MEGINLIKGFFTVKNVKHKNELPKEGYLLQGKRFSSSTEV